MKNFFKFFSIIAVIAAIGFSMVACEYGIGGVDFGGKKSNTTDLTKYDYVFRIVDVAAEKDSRFVAQVNNHTEKLQKLATIFSGIKSSGERKVATDTTLAELAQIAVTAYTNPEVFELVNDLAAEGLYVQFAYKEFLIDQCVIPENARSVGLVSSVLQMKVLTYDGLSDEPSHWSYSNQGIKNIASVFSARSLAVEQNPSVSLAVAKESLDIVKEYTQHYADCMFSSPNSIVTEQPDGSFLVVNGDTTSTLEFEYAAITDGSRGIWDKIKKAVCKAVDTVKEAFTNHPVTTVIAITLTIVGTAASAGLITLPAGLGISGTGLSGTISFTFFL